MAISFSQTVESSLVAFDNSEPLSSVRDPQGEALKWVYSLGTLPCKHAVIIGLGSGFHVAALADFDKDLKITVVDSRESLVRVFCAQFPELAERVEIVLVAESHDIFKTDLYSDVLKGKSYVLSFRECWGPRVKFFTELFAHLTGRSVESVRYHFEELGINIKALHFDAHKLISLKELMPAIEGSELQERRKQVFRVLNELVR